MFVISLNLIIIPGNVGPDNGLEGLGSDMQGFPAGMGAGAEPLGAYDQRNSPPNYQREEETPEEGIFDLIFKL